MRLEVIGQDIRYALRTLAKSPGFAAVIVMTLALSIGANSSIFSVIHGVLLKALPYPQPDRVVRLFYTNRSYPKFSLNHWDFRDYRARNRSFDALAAYTRHDVQLSGSGSPVRLTGFQVTAGFFRVLAINPSRGREFETKDELPGNGRLVILTDRVWRSRFDGDPKIVGRKVMLDSEPYTVCAVMPPGTEHPGNSYNPVASGETVDVWMPFTFEGNPAFRGAHYVEGIGRMRAGVSLAQAQADMSAAMAQLAREHPNFLTGWQLRVVPLMEEVVGPSRRLLLVLLGAVALVLLIACANTANLLLARATARRKEMAIRAALGAGRGRLVVQMLTESLSLAIVAGGLGIVLAAAGVRVLVALLPADFPRVHSIHVNATVFAFTFCIALLTGIAFGLAPALQAARVDLQRGLRESARGATSGAHLLHLRNLLVVGEVMLASVLLIGAGLMLRSFLNLLQADSGFRPEHVLTASVSLPPAEYKTADALSQFYSELLSRFNSIPGVTAAGLGTDLPWTGYDDNIGGFRLEGEDQSRHNDRHSRYHVASPDYFRAMGIPLLEGRFFSERDTKGSPRAILINEAMARRYWPKENIVGKRLTFDDHPQENDWLTIVGIVGDVKDRPNSPAAEPAFWWATGQLPWTIFRSMSIVVRATSDPSPLSAQLRAAVRQLNPGLAVADMRSLDDISAASFATPRVTLFLVGLFAALAIGLAAIGIFGVISYAVSQRTHEFGLRMALGAQPLDVLGLVMGHGMRLAFAGVAAGVAAAFVMARLLRTLLYEVGATDLPTFTTVPLIAIAVAALACYLPARRATRADPAGALRAE